MMGSFTRRTNIRLSPAQQDFSALALLTLLWLFYFWRVLTLQVSLPEGDFSGQFVAFGAYQYDRLVSGEIPLWNPYNYGGSPFIGDTQSAVFYPPRLLTIVGSYLTGGWTYASLQFEAIAHYWLAGVFMFLFVSRAVRSHTAGVASAIVFSYGGFLTGYPPLQLALLEAAVWLPLMLYGVYKASEGRSVWSVRWLSLAAMALGLSLLAGHPQTTLLSMYVLIAYAFFQGRAHDMPWWQIAIVLIYVLGLGFGLGAIQVLPGLEYTRLTIRTELSPQELAAGFPFSDLVVLILPNVVTRWSPLYNGIAALILAGIAGASHNKAARFWAIVSVVALLLSFGGQTILYFLVQAALPGYRWFRGQERLAFVAAIGISILAGYGIVWIQQRATIPRRWKRILSWSLAIAWIGAFQVMLIDGFFLAIDLFELKNGVVFLALLLSLAWLIIVAMAKHAASRWWTVAVVSLLVFDVFSITYATNWEAVPASERIGLSQLVDTDQVTSDIARIDGQWGVGGNFASMLELYDIRGISPLRLSALETYQTALPQYRLHELLSVKYVFTDWQELEVPSEIIATDSAASPPINLHELERPMPRAWLVSHFEVFSNEADSIRRLQDPAFDPRQSVILDQPPPPELDFVAQVSDGNVEVVRYAPERIQLDVETDSDAILVLSEWDYPGWRAEVDGVQTRILRANAGLRAIPVPAGSHVVTFGYRSMTIMVGAVISLLALGMLLINLGLLIRGEIKILRVST